MGAPSADYFSGFRLPSLRDCAGMTKGGVVDAREERFGWLVVEEQGD